MTDRTESNGRTSSLHVFLRQKAAIGEQASVQSTYWSVDSWMAALAKRGLQLDVDLDSSRMVLYLRGRLDQKSVPVLKSGFRELLALAPRVIDVDLGEVDRVDGLGVAAMVWAGRLASDHAIDFRLTDVRANVREIVTKMNLHYVLQIVDDYERLPRPQPGAEFRGSAK